MRNTINAQLSCRSQHDVTLMINALYSGLKDEADLFFQVEYMRRVKEGYYDVHPLTSVQEVLDELDAKVDYTLDNVGLYYNAGSKVWVRVFHGAKIPKNPDYMWEEKPV